MPVSSTLTVKTPVYEGPLELLLELIEKRKLLINDISLAEVADEYIARVRTQAELPVGETAEFVALAATLLLIKSRSLLPTLELSGDEQKDIKELQYRLALYQILKEAAGELGRFSKSPQSLFEGRMPEPPALFIPDASITVRSLREAAQAVIEGFPSMLALPKVSVKKIISIEEMVQQLATRVSSAFKLSFKEFTKGSQARGEVIVSFLALLELVKQGIIKATQEDKHGDITLESDAVTTPTYE
jgi:segregation and condensation protein A